MPKKSPKSTGEIFCPKCGHKNSYYLPSYQDGVSTGHNITCKGCSTDITIEDRTAYEQEGTVTITLC